MSLYLNNPEKKEPQLPELRQPPASSTDPLIRGNTQFRVANHLPFETHWTKGKKAILREGWPQIHVDVLAKPGRHPFLSERALEQKVVRHQ